MTTNIIDTAMALAALPSTYTGPGTLAAASRNAGGVCMATFGTFVSNGNVTQINVGFRPMRIRLYNQTDGIMWEWLYGMPVANAIKTTFTGPVIALDTSSQLTPSEPAGTGSGGNWIVTLGTTAQGTGKTLSYSVE